MAAAKLTATRSTDVMFSSLPQSPTILSCKQPLRFISYQVPKPSTNMIRLSIIRSSIHNAELESLISSNERPISTSNKLLSLLNLNNAKLGYHNLVSNSKYLLLLPLLFGIALTTYLWASFTLDDIFFLWAQLVKLDSRRRLLVELAVSSSAMAMFLATRYITSRPKGVYLVDFSCYKPDLAHKSKKESFVDMASKTGSFTKQSIAFQRRLLERSGIGQESYLPSHLSNPSMAEARKEAEDVMFGAIDELLDKTGVKVEDIGILVVNCSIFNPTPSLSAMIVNHYKLRSDILSYNLGGMGCSAGVISIDLANQLLQVNPNSYALVVSTENLTLHWYQGNDRSMLVSNCLFRMGCSAVLLSNRPSDIHRSKHELLHVVRTHKGADDRSYKCVFQHEDEAGVLGISLSKDLMSVAGKGLKTNIAMLGPLVLPLSEQLLFYASEVARDVFNMKKIKPYVPDFKLAFDHFCIHPGGKAVLQEIEKNLELTKWHMEPSKMTLYRFGNTSSSSIWYELAYMEAKERIKKGDRTWQIGFGSGFKCNSAVWRALRTINPSEERNPWMDEIDSFPVNDLEGEDATANHH